MSKKPGLDWYQPDWRPVWRAALRWTAVVLLVAIVLAALWYYNVVSHCCGAPPDPVFDSLAPSVPQTTSSTT